MGTLLRLPRVVREWRFIPTYMGNTQKIMQLHLILPVHPHVHGEHSAPKGGNCRGFGSSPRTWGTPGATVNFGGYTRFIPTYMGNTWATVLYDDTIAVHPHVHGEHFIAMTVTTCIHGSSPRTWGGGNTPDVRTSAENKPVHSPRTCGNTHT